LNRKSKEFSLLGELIELQNGVKTILTMKRILTGQDALLFEVS
jgi:hypothetical protein